MINTNRIRKAVFPAAGFGTRFLPATKAISKDLLPIFEKPCLQCAEEEAIFAGIDTMIFLIVRNKRAMQDSFDVISEFKTMLRDEGKDAQAEMVHSYHKILVS